MQPMTNEALIKQSLKKGCVMNELIIRPNKGMSFICHNCPDGMKNLCKSCLTECHKHHHSSIDKGNMVNFEDNPCECALHYHQVTINYLKKDILIDDDDNTKELSHCCIYNSLFSLYKPKYQYIHKKTRGVYCVYCAYHINQKREDNIAQSAIKQSNINLIFNINDIFDKKIASFDLNGNLPPCSCKNELHRHEIREEALLYIKSFFIKFDCIDKVNYIKMAYQVLKYNDFILYIFRDYFTIHTNIIESVEHPISIIDERKISLDDKIDWSLYIEITDLIDKAASNLKLFNNIGINIFNEEKQRIFSYDTIVKVLTSRPPMQIIVEFFETQRYYIRMHRRFYYGYYFKVHLLQGENTSFIHRSILSIKLNEELIRQGITIVELIFKLCKDLSDVIQIPQRSFVLMYNEGLKIIKKMIPFVSTNTLEEICVEIEGTIGCVIPKKEEQFKLIRTMEKIINLMITYINDDNFKFNYNKGNSDDIGEKNFFFEREVKRNFNQRILKVIFSLQNDIADGEYKCTLHHSVYDNLINENDYYIEPLVNIVNSTCYKKLNIISNEIMGITNKEIKDENIILFDDIEKVIVLYKELLDNKINEEIFLENAVNNLIQLSNKITNWLSTIKSNSPFTRQILFVKSKSYLKLLTFFILCKKVLIYSINIEDSQSEEYKKIKLLEREINTQIKGILLQLCNNNPLIASLYFQLNYIELIIGDNEEDFDFYINIAIILKKNNYLIDSLCILNYYIEKCYKTPLKSNRDNNVIITLLKLFKLILQISSSKCLMQINDIIASYLFLILQSKEFNTLFISDHIEVNFTIVNLVFKCICTLQRSYFDLLRQFIKIDDIVVKLQDFTVNIKKRKIYFKIYSLYYFESFSSLTQIEQVFNSNRIISPKIEQQTKDNSINNNDMIKELNPLILNLEQFGIYYKKNEIYFSSELNVILSYFKHTVLLPSLYAIYKITFFSNELNADLKYKVYNICNLFLLCLRFLLENITSYDIGEKHNIEIIKKYFNIRDVNHINELLNSVNDDINKIENSIIRPLNSKKIIELYLNQINHFTFYNNTFIHKQTNIDNNTNTSINIDTNSKLQRKINMYINKKRAFKEFNVLNNLFSLKNDDYDIIKRISLDLISQINFNSNKKLPFINQITKNKSDLLKSIQDQSLYLINPYINPFNESKTPIIETLCKVFYSHPKSLQQIITDDCVSLNHIIKILISHLFPFLSSIVFNQFNSLQKHSNYYYKVLINIIEFLRLLCENHNRILQTILINYQCSSESTSLNSKIKYDKFMTLVWSIPTIIYQCIKHSKEKNDLLGWDALKKSNSEYFVLLLAKITDFYIAVIQGTYTQNFIELVLFEDADNTHGFDLYFSSNCKIFDAIELESEYDFIISNFLLFLNCYIEEDANPIYLKTPVINKINPEKLLSLALSSFAKLVSKMTINHKVQRNCAKELLNIYKHDSTVRIENEPLFTISTQVYQYLKRVSHFKYGGNCIKINQILESIESIEDNEDNEFELKQLTLLKFEYNQFCSSLIKEVEICVIDDNEDDEREVEVYRSIFTEKFQEKFINERNKYTLNNKPKLERVSFMAHPVSLFLQHSDINTFLQYASYKDYSTKLSSILDYAKKFEATSKQRKTLFNNKVMFLLYSLPYNSLQTVNILLCSITSVLLILSEFNNFAKLTLVPFEIIHIIFELFIIINWFVFNAVIPNENNRDKNAFGYIYLINSLQYLITENEICWFTLTFLMGLIGLMHIHLHFLFSFELFAFINIFPGMQKVLMVIKMRYKQFLSTAFILIILILLYSSAIFYFFKQQDEGEYICRSYMECFFYLLSNGIRNGSLPFTVKIRGQEGYWAEFVFSWVFFFIVILIVLNGLVGIIVDSYQALIEEKDQSDEEKLNMCFICSLSRDEFEERGVRFDAHVGKEHNIENYVMYILTIMNMDRLELNSVDLKVYDAILHKKIEFFPIKKAKSISE